MQTFLPYPSLGKSAQCLDRMRLGKQRVEVLQIYRALRGETRGWVNHPATRMWRATPTTLLDYGIVVCDEWIRRGYRDQVQDKLLDYRMNDPVYAGLPAWWGDPTFHAAHRSNLLRKDEAYYRQFGWTEPTDLPYVWPVPLEPK